LFDNRKQVYHVSLLIVAYQVRMIRITDDNEENIENFKFKYIQLLFSHLFSYYYLLYVLGHKKIRFNK